MPFLLPRRRLPLLAAGLLAPALAPARPRAAPITVTDVMGRQLRLPAPPRRVVLGFYFEEYTAIGGTEGLERLVGLSRAPWAGWRPAIWSRYVAVHPRLDTLADVGASEDGNFSLEKLVALKPDLLILSEGHHKALADLPARIEALGIPILVLDYNAQTLERHLLSTRALGAALGEGGRAEALAQWYEAGFRDIQRRVQAAREAGSPRPRVYVELGQGGAGVIGNTYNGTMWGRIVETLGAENIAAGRIPGAWGPLHPEMVLAARPDVIVIAGSSWVNRPHCVRTGHGASLEETRASLAPYAAREGWAALPAVQRGEIHAIEHGLARTLMDIAPMQYLAKCFYPAQFADTDPVATLRAYQDRWLPVPYSGTWMARL